MSDSAGPIRFGAPPLSSRIQLIEASSSRLVLLIPRGGKRARSIGCFAVAWLAITGTVSGAFLFAAMGGAEWDGDPPPVWALLLFFSLFWAVGLGMGFAWLKMTFTRTYLALEPHQLATQRHFLGRKSTRILALNDNSSAELRSSYSENDQPVYHVAVDGADDSEKFGTALSYDEKEWIARTINQFLGHEVFDSSSAPDYCEECGTQLPASENRRVCPECGWVFHPDEAAHSSGDQQTGAGDPLQFGEVVPDLEPGELPADSIIRIDENRTESLQLSWPPGIPVKLKLFLGLFMGVFCTIWFGVIIGMWVAALHDGLEAFDLVFLLFSVPFIVVGMVPLGIFLFILIGRVQISVDQRHLMGRLGVGPLGYRKKVSTESVKSISLTVSDEDEEHGHRFSAAKAAAAFGKRLCMVHSTEGNLPLTMGSDEALDRQMCGLLRHQMHRMGYTLEDD